MYRFGDVAVDPRAREVVRGGEPAHLEPQAFDLLVHLIERRDEVVSKHDLLDGVWGHRFVSEAALTTRVKEIRRAVGDDGATQHTIRNIRGRGYRFVADLTDGGAPARSPHAGGLVGRDGDLDVLVARLTSPSLVTIVGPGGVGKSTLARFASHQIAGDLSDGAHVVELAPLTSGDDVLPALARALDTVLEPGRPDFTIGTIARLDALVVLDNCEHLVDDVADLVDRITATPDCIVRILATSQVRLGVAHEQVLGLAPLAADGAEALFVARAGATRPGWSVADVGAERLGALLAHLDRLPLMIEMAAARLGSMTFDDLEAAVGDGIQLVQMTHRTPTRRHRSPGSMVEWSADLLPAGHRRAFMELSVFAGAVTAADASMLIGQGAGATLAELTDRSLLDVDLDGLTARYRMLDTVKAVARRWLATSGSSSDAQRRHAMAVTEALERADQALRGPDEAAGRRRIDELVDEIRQAHVWAREQDVALAHRMCAALHAVSYHRLWSEPSTWAATMLADAGDGPPGARILVAGAAANRGDLELAAALASAVLDGPVEPAVAAMAHEILADVAMYTGQLDRGMAHAGALAELGQQLADDHVIAIGAIDRSILRTFGDDPTGGLAAVRDVDRSGMSRSNLAWIAYAEGEAHSRLSARDRAVESFGRAIDLAASVANPFVLSVARCALAAELTRAGATRAAYEVYGVGLRSALRHGNLVHAITMVRNLVLLLHAAGDERSATVLTTATANEVDRPSYGHESDDLAAVRSEIESAVWPDRFASWVAEGRALDVDGAVRRAVAIVETHLR